MLITEATARQYIDASNAGDHELMGSLFHKDALWLPLPPARSGQGATEIRERYRTEVKAVNAPIVAATYTADASRCVVEFTVDHPAQGRVRIVDVFDVDGDGLITRLAVYCR